MYIKVFWSLKQFLFVDFTKKFLDIIGFCVRHLKLQRLNVAQQSLVGYFSEALNGLKKNNKLQRLVIKICDS
jgi:hypothetical protein